MAAPVQNKQKLEKMKASNPFMSSTELVYNLILDDIVEHRIRPGQKLNQEQLADELDMSRTPVREALNMLSRDGYLSKGAQGYSVYMLKIGDYMAMLDLRIAMEQLASRLACSRIRLSELKKLDANIQNSYKLLDAGIKTAWNDECKIVNDKAAEEIIHELGKMDQQFHHIIVNGSHNKYLIQSYEDLEPKIHFFRFTAMDVNCCLNMVDRHKMISDAIAMRDEELAMQRMRSHLELTVSRAMRY